jgi:hypothetical protein
VLLGHHAFDVRCRHRQRWLDADHRRGDGGRKECRVGKAAERTTRLWFVSDIGRHFGAELITPDGANPDGGPSFECLLLADFVAKVADKLFVRSNGIRTIAFLNQYCTSAPDLESMCRYEGQNRFATIGPERNSRPRAPATLRSSRC